MSKRKQNVLQSPLLSPLSSKLRIENPRDVSIWASGDRSGVESQDKNVKQTGKSPRMRLSSKRVNTADNTLQTTRSNSLSNVLKGGTLTFKNRTSSMISRIKMLKGTVKNHCKTFNIDLKNFETCKSNDADSELSFSSFKQETKDPLPIRNTIDLNPTEPEHKDPEYTTVESIHPTTNNFTYSPFLLNSNFTTWESNLTFFSHLTDQELLFSKKVPTILLDFYTNLILNNSNLPNITQNSIDILYKFLFSPEICNIRSEIFDQLEKASIREIIFDHFNKQKEFLDKTFQKCSLIEVENNFKTFQKNEIKTSNTFETRFKTDLYEIILQILYNFCPNISTSTPNKSIYYKPILKQASTKWTNKSVETTFDKLKPNELNIADITSIDPEKNVIVTRSRAKKICRVNLSDNSCKSGNTPGKTRSDTFSSNNSLSNFSNIFEEGCKFQEDTSNETKIMILENNAKIIDEEF